jgi:hypothetical protein
MSSLCEEVKPSHEQVRQENLSMAQILVFDADAPIRNLLREVLELEGSSSLRLCPRPWRCQTSRMSLPFNMTEASKRLHAAEGLRVARSLVVGKSTMLLR